MGIHYTGGRNLEISWIELSKLLDKIEKETEPQTIIVKRQHLRDDRNGYDFSLRTHFRYGDYSILTASVTGGKW